jgi:pimeloyl-ACP methyl ester carboxylesterase
MRPKAKRGLVAFACFLVLFAGAVGGVGQYLSAPVHHSVGNPPPDLFATAVLIPHQKGYVAGWVARGADSGAPAAARRARGTGLVGAQPPRRKDRRDRRFAGRGGAAAGQTGRADRCAGHRSDVSGHCGRGGKPAGHACGRSRPLAGATVADAAAVAQLACPVFVIGGADDRHTPADETRAIFAAAHEPKQLWLVDGAAHVDLHGAAGTEYETRIARFLAMHLRKFEAKTA